MASTGLLSDYLTPAVVTACALAESAPSPRYLFAADCLPAFAGVNGQHDASDVASLARVLLATVAASMPAADGKALANVATYRARQALSAMDVRQRGDGAEYAAGDTLAVVSDDDDAAARTSIPRVNYTRPDACATWTRADTLAALADCVDDDDALVILSTMASAGTVSAVGRALGIPTTGKRAAKLSARIDDVIGAARASVPTVLSWLADESAGPDRARALDRDPSMPTSGTASAVILTRPNGDRWACLPTVTVRVDESGAAVVLATVDTVPTYVGGTRREIDAAALDDAWERGQAGTARRPNGVGAGMRYGSKVAGMGAPEPRPTMSRKRKRDGGIGSPMSPC